MNAGEGNKNNVLDNNPLVLSIDDDGKITFFNKELEKQVGYYKNEVVDKKNFELFIPEDYKKDFQDILYNAKNEKVLTDLFLPLVNKKGDKIMTSWDIAPVDDTNLGKIGFVGRLLNENSETNISNPSNKMIFNLGNKKIFFKKPVFSSKEKNEKEKNINHDKKKSSNSQQKQENSKPPVDQYNPDKLKENVEVLNKKIEYLEILEQENLELKKKLKELKVELSTKTKKIKYLEEKQNSLIKNSHSFVKDSVGFIFDVVGGKKKKEEFEAMLKELDERRENLKNLEDNLNNEKIRLNKSVDEFVEWREKLETLEDEVETRREFLVSREQKTKDNVLSYVDEGVSKKKEVSSNDKPVENDPSELIDNLNSAAVILQRGILKHANNHFADLIGLSSEKILNKSFFDFISSDGLSSFEKYYLDRLKGETSDYYNTVLLTGENKELPVKVDIKPVFYDGSLVDKLVVLDMSENIKDNVNESKTSSTESNKLNQNQINNIIKEKPDKEVESSETDKTSSSSDSGGGKMNQDEISAMFAKERGEKVEEKTEKKSVGGVPGVVTQDQIDDMVKKAQKEKKGTNTTEKENKSEEKPESSDESSNTDKMSQDEISDMMEKAKEKPDEKSTSDTSNDSNSSSGSKMSQDDITAMMEKARSEKKENKK